MLIFLFIRAQQVIIVNVCTKKKTKTERFLCLCNKYLKTILLETIFKHEQVVGRFFELYQLNQSKKKLNK